MKKAEISFCEIDKLFYISYNGEEIHAQPKKPNETEIIEALSSDNWEERFNDMRNGKKVRVSDRIYYQMLGAVPPIKHTQTSFFCGERYSGNLYYFFSKENGKKFGELKAIEG